MKIILLNNTTAQILASDKLVVRLDDYLACPDPSARFTAAFKRGRWDGKIRYMHGDCLFPIGLFPGVVKWCKEHYKNEPIIIDQRIIPSSGKEIHAEEELNGVKLRDYQFLTVSACLNHGVEGIRFNRGIISAATNAGKSIIGAAIIKSLSLPCLFLTHRVEIANQITEWYGKYLAMEIGEYNSKKNNLKPVTVAMITTLYARRHKYEVGKLLGQFPVLIVDEAHHASSKSWKYVIENSTAYYKYGLSGTALKLEQHRNRTMIGLFGSVLTKITNVELVEKGVSAKPEIKMIKYKAPQLLDDCDEVIYTDNRIKEIRARIKVAKELFQHKEVTHYENMLRDQQRELYSVAYKFGVSLSKYRTKAVKKIVEKHDEQQILIIVSKLPHGKYLSKKLDCTFISGKHDDATRAQTLKDFISGKIRVLVATMIYKEGIDVPSIDVLVLAQGEKSQVTMLQTFGRGLRIKPGKTTVPVYDFYDSSFKKLEDHSKERLAIYKKEKFNPKIIAM